MEANTYSDPKFLREELERFKNFSISYNGYDIYLLPAIIGYQYPHIMEEIGFQRKSAFSSKGAGGDDILDIDKFDKFYHQLIVVKNWVIVAGYRFFLHKTINSCSSLDMGRLFDMKNIKHHLPSIELGRSWVKPSHQNDGKTISLLLTGLAIIRTVYLNHDLEVNRDVKFWFGKITNPPNVNPDLLNFLDHYHPDIMDLITPKEQYIYCYKKTELFQNNDYRSAKKRISNTFEAVPILKLYLFLANKNLITYGTVCNECFGKGISETGIAISFGSENPEILKKISDPIQELVLSNKDLLKI